jgi:hypothetical protein
MIWTNEADELLLKLWMEGKSMLRTSLAMRSAGYDVTRNAIAGRVWRLKHNHGITIKGRAAPMNFDEEQQYKKSTDKPKPSQAEIDEAAQSRLATIMKKASKAVMNEEPVDYLENHFGCKALLDQRGGPWNLPMCCGRPRGYDAEGRRSVYCQDHFNLFHNHPTERRYG